MSFSFNGPSFRPMIQEAQSMKNNGGGGNTGYFQRESKKEEKEEIDVFSHDSEDSFTLSSIDFDEKKEDKKKEEKDKKKVLKNKFLKTFIEEAQDFIKKQALDKSNI